MSSGKPLADLKTEQRQAEWNHMDPYTGADFIADSIRQARELEQVRRDWERDFLADLERMREWL